MVRFEQEKKEKSLSGRGFAGTRREGRDGEGGPMERERSPHLRHNGVVSVAVTVPQVETCAGVRGSAIETEELPRT